MTREITDDITIELACSG